VSPRLTSDIPLIEGNRSQLQQVILNLIHNAVEAMASTTDRARVLQLRTVQDGIRGIAVAVEDSGPGIDPNRLDGIFDAFVTTKTAGIGLGLAIFPMIVRAHGGPLTATSDGKSRALVQFFLPFRHAGHPH